MIRVVETDKHSIMSPLELVLLDPENVSILGPVEKWELAVDENTPAEALRLLCLEDTVGQLSNEIANNPNSPSDAVQLAETRLMSSNERVEAATNSHNHYILEGLASNEDELVRVGVAGNPNTLQETLIILAKDEDELVRGGVASNHNTPPEILIMLAKDKKEYVRITVADNPNTLPETLTMLAKDNGENVRIVVAYNRRTPYKVLKILTMDEDKDVRDTASFVLQHN